MKEGESRHTSRGPEIRLQRRARETWRATERKREKDRDRRSMHADRQTGRDREAVTRTADGYATDCRKRGTYHFNVTAVFHERLALRLNVASRKPCLNLVAEFLNKGETNWVVSTKG